VTFVVQLLFSPLPLYFFLMILPPPSSTLFPYMTLFRSYQGRVYQYDVETGKLTSTLDSGHTSNVYALAATADGKTLVTGSWDKRSEEHTSELQSRVDVVCRLLLEKKRRGGIVQHTRSRP